MSDLQELLSALDVFSRAPDKSQIERANNFLLDFQHSPDAWATANTLLMSPDAPLHARIFAAQTFRSKVTYDLHQVDERNLQSLRDILLSCLAKYQDGPKTITTQLCLALSGLALQFPTWSNAVQSMIDSFGSNPASVLILLKFLTFLPEEITMNSRIPLTDEDYNSQSQVLIADNADVVIQLLVMYIHATGVTPAVQDQVLRCLRSWLISGYVSISKLSTTTLFQYVFDALESELLFDPAVDTLCEMIHETQEIEENMSAIQLILPRLVALRPRIAAAGDDSEKAKGYARIFTEAGETYRVLIMRHTETFFPLVEAVGECSAHSDLEVVSITFPFWMRLTQVIDSRDVSPLFASAFQTLMSVMIGHLHFPESSQHDPQELDDFRSFRHNIGDTLKDCCIVLKTKNCLMMVYEMIMNILSKGSAASWQEVEAPLFAIRAMGGQFNPAEDSEIIPKILDVIPSLPAHPQIRYTTILIVSRYTEWTALHPQYIQAQLEYISGGFNESNDEIVGAAVLALRYICRDCKQHLISFLPTLHTFLQSSGSNLSQEHKRDIYEAIGHVISAMPMEQAAESLRTFSLELLSQVHNATVEGSPTPESIRISCQCLENLETLLAVVESFGEILPAACQNTCLESWQVLDTYLINFGSDFGCSERVTRVLRHGLSFFGSASLPVASSVVTRMALAFKSTAQPGYLWISGKIIDRFGSEQNLELRTNFQATYETITFKMTEILQESPPDAVAGVLEDYVHVVMPLLDNAPDILFQLPVFHSAFKCCMVGLTVVYSDLVMAVLDIFRDILMHDCLNPHLTPVPPNFPSYSNTIRQTMEQEGQLFLQHLFNGIMGSFPEGATSSVVTIFRFLCTLWPSQMVTWLPPTLQQIPPNILSNEAKSRFLEDVNNAIHTGHFEKLKSSILNLDRAARKARERRRVDRFEL